MAIEVNILDDSKEWIAGVAIIADHDGVCHWLPAPNRHHHILDYLDSLSYPTPITGEQGFVTNYGNFVTPWEALGIADAANQLKEGFASSVVELFSEDIW